jgi:alpha-glucosidase
MNPTSTSHNWWQHGVLYQIYPRSFQDSNHDGVGDLRGIINRLDYVQNLGVAGVWLNPFFESPMADFGYDISDYRQVDPMFGTNQDLLELIAQCHKRNLRHRDAR